MGGREGAQKKRKYNPEQAPHPLKNTDRSIPSHNHLPSRSSTSPTEQRGVNLDDRLRLNPEKHSFEAFNATRRFLPSSQGTHVPAEKDKIRAAGMAYQYGAMETANSAEMGPSSGPPVERDINLEQLLESQREEMEEEYEPPSPPSILTPASGMEEEEENGEWHDEADNADGEEKGEWQDEVDEADEEETEIGVDKGGEAEDVGRFPTETTPFSPPKSDTSEVTLVSDMDRLHTNL